MARYAAAWWRGACSEAWDDAFCMPLVIAVSPSWVLLDGRCLSRDEARRLASRIRRQAIGNLIDAALWWSVPLSALLTAREAMRSGYMVMSVPSFAMFVIWVRIMLPATFEAIRASTRWLIYARGLRY